VNESHGEIKVFCSFVIAKSIEAAPIEEGSFQKPPDHFSIITISKEESGSNFSSE
jgi:hypothetical protein